MEREGEVEKENEAVERLGNVDDMEKQREEEVERENEAVERLRNVDDMESQRKGEVERENEAVERLKKRLEEVIGQLEEEQQWRRLAEDRVFEQDRDWHQQWEFEVEMQEVQKVMEGERLEQHKKQLDDLEDLEKQLQVERKKRKEMEEKLKMIIKLAGEEVEGRNKGGEERGSSHSHQGQPWLATQGLSPGGAMSSAFYKGMAKHSPANSFLGERLDSSRR